MRAVAGDDREAASRARQGADQAGVLRVEARENGTRAHGSGSTAVAASGYGVVIEPDGPIYLAGRHDQPYRGLAGGRGV